MRCTKCERRLDHGAIRGSQRDYNYGIVLEEPPSIWEISVSSLVQGGNRSGRCELTPRLFFASPPVNPPGLLNPSWYNPTCSSSYPFSSLGWRCWTLCSASACSWLTTALRMRRRASWLRCCCCIKSSSSCKDGKVPSMGPERWFWWAIEA